MYDPSWLERARQGAASERYRKDFSIAVPLGVKRSREVHQFPQPKKCDSRERLREVTVDALRSRMRQLVESVLPDLFA